MLAGGRKMDPISLESDAIQLCNMIRCLAEEWGPEHLEIQVPKIWSAWDNTMCGGSQLHFVTEDSVVLIVGNGDDTFRREVKLSPSCVSRLGIGA
jgi:hypothetical protein